jgi:sporulation protein YlmC with PRC-barrel domain
VPPHGPGPFMGGIYLYWPYSVPESERYITLEHEHVPPGELAVRRGAHVEAADGHVGQVDEFLVDPRDEHITHLIMREGHLWGQKDVSIPVSAIDHIEEDTVHLELSKREIEALPAIPIRQWSL